MLLDYAMKRYTINHNVSVKAALRKLNADMPVFLLCISDNGKLWGILTLGDINRWLIEEGNHSLDIPVGEVCNRAVLTAKIGTSSAEIRHLLDRISGVPLLNEDGTPIAVAINRLYDQGFRIGDVALTKQSPSYIIAEIANNHNGKLDIAKRLIDLAKQAGADCAKFQLRDMPSLYGNRGMKQGGGENLGTQYVLDLLTRFQLSPDELFAAFEHCRNVGLEPLCTPWDLTSVKILEEFGVRAYKVASADLTNHQLLENIARTGKPLICSTGMSHESEIRQAVALLRREGAYYALLHCNSTYPTPFKDVHLMYIDTLRDIGECLVGYSGHERDIFVPVAAIARGAKIIEKHFTLDRNMEGNDHRVSLLPHEFARMVEGIRQVEETMGASGTRKLSQGEMMNRVTLAKSIFANCDINEGEQIEPHMLAIKSPGHGLQPSSLADLTGRPALRAKKTGDVFYPADLALLQSDARPFHFSTRWGLPVRYHDYQALAGQSNPDCLEFHFSYKDIELDYASFFTRPVDKQLIVHAPELFAGDHVLDLAATDEGYRQHSIQEMQRVIDVVRDLRTFFNNSGEKIGIITNVGGFSFDGPLSAAGKVVRQENLCRSLDQLTDDCVEIWPQTMPPFPWHFGGQRYHNLFLSPEEIVGFCQNRNMRVCLDVSHSKLTCNYLRLSFQRFLELVLPYTAHIHIADAKGVDDEGLQLGEGEVDFYALLQSISEYAPKATWIPEIWQGHEDNGRGFWQALNFLERAGL